MNKTLTAIIAANLIFALSLIPTLAADAPVNALARVCFTPGSDCEDMIVKAINAAKSEVLVQAFSFTSKPIAKALIDAKKRWLRVEVVLDQSNRSDKYTAAAFTAGMGIPTYIDGKHTIAHNKIMVIDRSIVITGSYNFTRAANRDNAENMLVLTSRELAADYLRNFEAHKSHSEVYKPRY